MSVIIIHVPPLRERLEDIPLLVEHFAQEIAISQGKAAKMFSPKAIEELKKLQWTGNIRELRNVVERLIILSGNEVSDKDVKLFARPLA